MCRPLHLWGSRAPTTGFAFYANVLATILQCLSCVCHPWVAESMGHLVHAKPRESGPQLAIAPGRVPDSRTSVPAPSACLPPILPNAALHRTYMADPTTCPSAQ
jgi:hypothetical protein